MWKSNEVTKLMEIYPNKENVEIAKTLGRTKSSIDNKAYRLGLKKSDKFLKERNKMGHITKVKNGGRDLTFETLEEIASKYKTKIEFIKNDEPAYQAVVNKGILDEVCGHMSVMKFSTPQIILEDIMDNLLELKCSYNDRKIIKPYELDLYYDEYKLAFEFQGLYWHSKHKNNDELKIKLCSEKGITLIHIYENSRDYEGDIKIQLIKHLDKINLITNNKFSENDILNIVVNNPFNKLYNKEELINLTKKYNSFKIFKLEQPKVYRKLLQLGIVDIATKHMSDKRKRVKLTISEISDIVNKYDNLTDFRSNELKLYKHIKRTKKDYLIKHLKRK